tara:strand:- start:3641 stop:4132 length:492 start_codon:yes stop_codon:yes gene_type:complete
MHKILFFFILLTSLSLASQEKIELSKTVPNFKFWLIDDSKLTNKDIQGKVVVFKFWFTSCMPCLTDIPKLNKLVEEFKNNKDILFIAPALDRKPIIEKLLEVHPFNFKIAYSAMDVSRKFNKTQVYPSYFVIDKKGHFTYIDSGTKKSEFKNLREAIVKTLEM